MANTVQLKKDGQIVYPITDRSCIIGLEEGPVMSCRYAWDGTTTPDVTKIPAGVTVEYNSNTYTGTLAASASTVGYQYLVYNPTSTEFDRYATDATGGSYAWKAMGDTTIQSPDIADNLTTNDSTKALSAKQGKILNEELEGLEAKVDELEDGYIAPSYTLMNGAINTNGSVGSGTTYKHTTAIPVKKGQKVKVSTAGYAFALISKDENGTYTPQMTVDSGDANVPATYIWIAPNDMNISVSVKSTIAFSIGIETDYLQRIEFLEGEIADLDETLSAEINTIKTGQEQNYVSGKYLSVVGGQLTEVEAEGWGITDFVPYTYDNPVEWRYANDGSAPGRSIAFFNSNKEYITNAYWGATSVGVRIITSSEIQTWANGAAFIRASFKIGDGCYIKENGTTTWQPQKGSLGLQMLQEEITGIGGDVANLNTRVTALENGAVDDSAEILNKFKDSAIVGISSMIGTQVPKVKNKFLCFLHISDIHGDAERMKRAITFANSQNNITAILATGDFSQSEWNNNGFEKTFTELYQTADIPMLPVIGNHDVGLSKKIYSTNPNTNSAVGARFISPFMTALGCVQGGTDAGYYYKDFSSFKVRLIVVNEYEMPRVPNAGNTELKYSIWGRYFSQEQADWLVSTLNSVQSGWSVIIATHQLIDVFSKYDNEFKGAVNYSNADVEMAQVGMLQDIVDAYIAKGTLTKTYSVSGADTTEVPDVSVSADFSGANGEFICYINGHTHNDGTGQSSYAQSKQVNINVTTGSANVANQAVYDDLYRDNDTIAQDAFNLVAFDTINKKIRMLRIGANVTMDMKRRDYALIPYSQS